MVEFNQRLDNIIKKRDITQTKLAELLQVNSQLINNYTRGVNAPTIENLVWLAEYFGVSMEYLFGLTNKMAPQCKVKLYGVQTGNCNGYKAKVRWTYNKNLDLLTRKHGKLLGVDLKGMPRVKKAIEIVRGYNITLDELFRTEICGSIDSRGKECKSFVETSSAVEETTSEEGVSASQSETQSLNILSVADINTAIKAKIIESFEQVNNTTDRVANLALLYADIVNIANEQLALWLGK